MTIRTTKPAWYNHSVSGKNKVTIMATGKWAQLVLRHDEVPPAQLSSDPSTGPRLGWNVWLPSAADTLDRDDAVLALESTAEALSA